MVSVGFTMPFARTTSSLGLLATTTSDIQAAKVDLKSLLLTNWGERPMHYDLGCNFKEFLFEQRGQDMNSRIEERIRSQVGKWMPFLAINQILITSPDDHRIKVQMKFHMISHPDTIDTLNVEVSG